MADETEATGPGTGPGTGTGTGSGIDRGTDPSDAPPVRDYTVAADTTLSELLDRFADAGGFTATLVADGARILRRMRDDPDMAVVLAFPAAPVATGLRGVLARLVEAGFADAVVTTCGTLDHDVARGGEDYLHGAFELDDAALAEAGLHRLGNVLVPEEAYGPAVEAIVRPLLFDLWDDGVERLSGRDLCRRLGEGLPDGSILRACADRGVPVFVPGITDGAVGSQLWLFAQDHDLHLDLLDDEKALDDLVHGADRTGALIVGGGIAKHHTIWWAQFAGGLDAAVYVTTAPEWDGSLSGARLREGISWGKVRVDATQVTIPGEATVVLPLLAAAVLDG